MTPKLALVEREEVLETIEVALRRSKDGVGAAIVLEGAPGLGKSSVLAVARGAAGDLGMRVLSALGGELERGLAWGIARELLGASARKHQMQLQPAAAAALGVRPGSAADDPIAVAHALTELCVELAEDQPLLLVVDDAHWSDRMSASWLAYLAPRVGASGLVLLIATRPQGLEQPPELEILGGRERVQVVKLSALSGRGASALVRQTLPDADDALCTTCQQACTGNPFLLAELARELAARHSPEHRDSVEEVAIDRVDRIVRRRLAAAGADAAVLARVIAVLGKEASLGDAGAIAELSDARVGDAADTLRDAGLLRDVEAGSVSIAHPLLRSAVDRSTAPGRRSGLHLRAARHFDSHGEPVERIGAHLLLVEPGSDAWIQKRLEDAGDAALAAGAGRDAVALYQRSIAERTHGDVRPLLLAKLARAALRFDPAAAEGPLRGAIALTEDPNERMPLVLDLAVTLQTLGRFGEAVEALDALSRELRQAGAPRAGCLRVEAELLAQAFFDKSTRALRRRRLAQAVAGLTGEAEEELLIVVQQAVDSINTAAVREARDLAERAWADGRLERLVGSKISPATMWIPYIHLYVDDYDWTIRTMRRWLEEAREAGSSVLTAFTYGILAEAQWRAGDLHDAAASANAAWTIARELGATTPAWWIAIGTLAQARLATGDASGAAELLHANGILQGPAPTTMLMPLPRAVRAEALIATGETQRGVDELLDTLKWVDHEQEPSPGGWRFPATLVDGLLALDRREQATDVARSWLRRTRSFGVASTHGMAERSLALTRRGDHQLAGLRRAEALLAASPARLEHARCLLELGAAARRAGHRSAAREPLAQALDVATRCGASPLAQRARSELVACGFRPRRALQSGAESLTPSERRVSQLAADGLTNREIAAALFLSRKTVERHLTNTYVKLGLNDRGRLANALRANSG